MVLPIQSDRKRPPSHQPWASCDLPTPPARSSEVCLCVCRSRIPLFVEEGVLRLSFGVFDEPVSGDVDGVPSTPSG